jgi:hypothetical protein
LPKLITKNNPHMRKKLQLVASLSLLALSFNGFAQRYLAPVFTSVTVSTDVVYGNNISVITGSPAASSLKMDVYQPTNDSITARPLVVVLHTGSFLPAIANGQPTGNKSDSAVVEMCMRFAKKGYVAVAADYRLGWNPISTDQDVRTSTLLQAVYRAIQDAKNCVRFFKNDKATANTYKIDTTKIAVGGLGSGGYVALAYASLNQVSEIQLSKFINNNTTPPTPYIDQTVLGNFDGTNTAAINTPNYPTHTSTINMVFNVGGAVGDTTWIQHGEVPIVSLQCTKDPNAPYTTGEVIVPTTGQNVVVASGAYDVMRIVNKPSINNNAIFHNSIYTDVYTNRSNAVNHGLEGLFPFQTPAPGAALPCGAQAEQGSPWDWWNSTYFIAAYNAYSGTTNGAGADCIQHESNPDSSPAKGRLYIDTIQGYVAPRMVCALGLAGCVPNPAGVTENTEVSGVRIFPNPSSNDINISVLGSNSIQRVELYDLTGRMVKQVVGLNAHDYTVQREGLAPGLYITKVQLAKGVITKKIILE